MIVLILKFDLKLQFANQKGVSGLLEINLSKKKSHCLSFCSSIWFHILVSSDQTPFRSLSSSIETVIRMSFELDELSLSSKASLARIMLSRSSLMRSLPRNEPNLLNTSLCHASKTQLILDELFSRF
ncbi:hypothetical protein BpHYR1_046427 [Brachionus plicatilis]|uniref:Uncharacterized protein n=1 Tax=Brachionus plicatilis TaxID=10195 RepID=A0A3M7T7W3_BRAPC|nr:hypothetical protein BpHYR1_046427 [Brachionus plicatilis]